MKRNSVLAIVISALFLSSCDTFNVLDQFEKASSTGPGNDTDNGLSLSAQKTSITQGESVILYPGGGNPPYSFAVMAEDLYYSAGNDIGTISGETFTAQQAVGKVKIRTSDQDNSSADLVITVLPLAPGNFSASPGSGNNEIDLAWTYGDNAYISGFRIVYSTDGSNYSTISPAPIGTDLSFVHTSLNQTKTYYYRMYAVAGSYESGPTTIRSAQPN